MTLKRVTEDEEGADNCEAKGADECCHSMVDSDVVGSVSVLFTRVQSYSYTPQVWRFKCLLEVSEVNEDGNYYVGTEDNFEGDVSALHCLAIVGVGLSVLGANSVCRPTERLNPKGVKLVDTGVNELGFAELKVDEVFDLPHDLHPESWGQRLKVVAFEGVDADAVDGGVDEVLDLRGIDVKHSLRKN